MRFLLAALAVLLFAGSAEAANRFWVPVAVTGAANNGSGLCRLTVGAGLATGKVTGETVTVASVGGATGCNVTTTITAIDATHIDLVGTTFGGVYTSGGTISGGTWNATNIGNWGTASGTGSGASIPGTTDTATFDASSGGGIVTIAASIGGTNTIQTLAWGAFTGTIDADTNNPSITLTNTAGFSGSGTGTRVFNGDGSTWTMPITTASASYFTMSVTTNCTCDFDGTTIIMNGSNAFTRGFVGGGLSYGTLTIGANAGAGSVNISGSNTFGTLNFTGPGELAIASGSTQTITNAVAWTTASGIPLVAAVTPGTLATIALTAAGTAGSNLHPFGFRDMTFSTSALAAIGYDLGNNAGTITITAPATGGGAHGQVFGGP